jgi:predicted glycosyltransferase
MRILIDIGHPAHVHLYRNFYHEMKKRGHELTVTVKEIPAAMKLMDVYGIPFISLGSKSDSIAGKAVRQLMYDLRMLKIVKRQGIETGVGSSITLAHVSKLSSMKSVIFDDDDDEVEPLFTGFGHSLADILVSPDVLKGKRGRKDTVFYPGYHELAYLHPDRFTPDPSVLADAGLKENEIFFVLRFNAFKAHHDGRASGLQPQQKTRLVKFLEKQGRVLITNENETMPEFSKNRIKISPDRIHSLLFYSTMFIGDSQTMTSEAAVLGVPSLRCNTFAGRISYLEEQEKKYGLTFAFRPDEFDLMMNKLSELVFNRGLKAEWQLKRREMLKDKKDVTAFMIELIEGINRKGRHVRSDYS